MLYAKGFIYNDFGEECAEIYADSSSILHIVLALHFMIMMMVGSHLAKIDQLLLPPHAAAAALCCKSSVQSTPPLHITRWGIKSQTCVISPGFQILKFGTAIQN